MMGERRGRLTADAARPVLVGLAMAVFAALVWPLVVLLLFFWAVAEVQRWLSGTAASAARPARSDSFRPSSD